MGLRIFIHAIWLVFANLAEALRVSIVPYLLLLLAAVALAVIVSATGLADLSGSAGEWLRLLVAIALTIVNVWVAVAWHRFILLGEGVSRAAPRFRGGRIAAYIARSFLLGFALVPPGLLGLGALTLVENNVLNKLSASVAQAATFVLIPIVFAPTAIVVCRLFIVLPATAVGNKLRWRDAWSATRGTSIAGLVISVLVLAGSYLIELPVTLQLEAIPIALRIIWQLVAAWLETLVVLGILSTLYAVYVEKRPLDAAVPVAPNTA